jgi:hypothetical protein
MDRERTVTVGSARAPSGPRRRRLPRPGPETRLALRESWRALWTSRLAVWVAGVLGLLWIGRVPNTAGFDPARLTEPFSSFGDILVGPFARWDSVWFLSIARDGYGPASDDHAKTAFFPLYPLLVHVGGWIVRSQLLAGVLISLACFLAALVLLHRLAAIELGLDDARGTILLLAFFPTALFFSAVYSESLFLLLTVGAVLAARQGRWAWAGVAGLLAALTRNSGVLLLVPLVLLFLYGPRADRPLPPDGAAGHAAGWRRLLPRHPLTPELLWLVLVPLGLVLYCAYCAVALGDALAPFHAQKLWFRHFVPLGGVTDGARAAWLGLRQLVHGSPTPVYFREGGGDAFSVAAQSLMLFGFLVLVVVGVVGALRRLPFAYGAYAAVALLFTVSNPIDAQPLISLPRYVVVLFPLQLWLAQWCGRRGGVERAVGVSAVLLGLFAAQFARWGFVA